jgi:hypothetical protein
MSLHVQHTEHSLSKGYSPFRSLRNKGRSWVRFSNLKATYTALFLVFSNSPRYALRQYLETGDDFSEFINHNHRPIKHHMQFRKLVVSSLRCTETSWYKDRWQILWKCGPVPCISSIRSVGDRISLRVLLKRENSPRLLGIQPYFFCRPTHSPITNLIYLNFY